MADCSSELRDAVLEAIAVQSPLRIAGAGSKAGYFGREIEGTPLDVTAHCGITDYQPDELVISARAGTPIAQIQAALAGQDQMLPAECPLFGGAATLGGSVACNASGPGRPWRGALRDSILGLGLINGRGEILRYGGQVMKNVAGYDVSRLQAGAQGTLGVITDVTLRVVPKPAREITLAYTLPAAAALARMVTLAGLPGPVSGACWIGNTLYLRASGTAAGVEDFRRRQGGDLVSDKAPWKALDTLDNAPFSGTAPLWRLSVAPSSPLSGAEPDMIDWGGALRFFAGGHDPVAMQDAALAAGGRAQLWRGGDRHSDVNGPMSSVEKKLQQRLKEALDPGGIFNPGRLFSDG
ncbi:glycolate oxidase subunit GlcE [Chromatocurvus halotolerans]|uniref:Glycolate oxidase FAD binding subunit n=1 Tax=Chromatocurvus halotolerans TaxID=1132028 RepID=A0A4R2KZB7_9GAMM|nr:glycolate oxidase subunit GlcE [Chromatocurvus halotolerans]TCO75628.1 glycolate oxidase FAD binding subunit [Chromatocurvus halotolerans]